MGENNEWTPARKGQLGIAVIDGELNPIKVEATQRGTVTHLLRLATGKVCTKIDPDLTEAEHVYWTEVHLLNKGHFHDLEKLAERWGKIGNGKNMEAYKKVAAEHFRSGHAARKEQAA